MQYKSQQQAFTCSWADKCWTNVGIKDNLGGVTTSEVNLFLVFWQ